jgi:hypothetical protein
MLTKIQYLRKKPSVGMGADPNSGYGGAYGANSVVTTDEFGNVIPGGGGGSSIDANGNVTDEFGNIIPGGGTVIPDYSQEEYDKKAQEEADRKAKELADYNLLENVLARAELARRKQVQLDNKALAILIKENTIDDYFPGYSVTLFNDLLNAGKLDASNIDTWRKTGVLIPINISNTTPIITTTQTQQLTAAQIQANAIAYAQRETELLILGQSISKLDAQNPQSYGRNIINGLDYVSNKINVHTRDDAGNIIITKK